jgi:hypothetical protein
MTNVMIATIQFGISCLLPSPIKKRKGKKGKVIPVLNYALCHEDIWGSGSRV